MCVRHSKGDDKFAAFFFPRLCSPFTRDGESEKRDCEINLNSPLSVCDPARFAIFHKRDRAGSGGKYGRRFRSGMMSWDETVSKTISAIVEF